MLTATTVDFLMRAVMANRLSRWEAYRLVDPCVAHGEPVSGGLALSGAELLHGFAMTDDGNPNPGNDPQRWSFSDEEMARRIAGWQREYHNVQNGDGDAWKKWMRPRPKVSSLEVLEGLFRWMDNSILAGRLLPDRRYATVVGFLQGYDSGHKRKLKLDGFNEWLVCTYSLDPKRPWFVNVLYQVFGSMGVEKTAMNLDENQEAEAVDWLHRLLREYLVCDGLDR